MKKTTVLNLLFVFVFISIAQAQEKTGPGEIDAYVFSDIYWMASHHNQAVEGNNGMWIRRVYFTYDRSISEAFSARFRLEASSSGDFITDPKLSPVVKDLYLKWENERHQVVGGISSTPTWGLVEDVWGYRSIEKTPLDVMGFGSSRDFGVSLQGQLDGEGLLNYHLMVGNGNSNRPEINLGKKAMFSLSYALTEHLVVEAYGDWNNNPGDTDWITYQGFAAYQSDNLNAGLLYAHQNRANAVQLPGQAPSDLNLDLVSFFARFALSGTAAGYIRIDHAFDPVPGLDDNDYLPISSAAEPTVLIGGVDFEVGPGVHLMPNIESVVYGETAAGGRPDTDLIPRLTLFYNF